MSKFQESDLSTGKLPQVPGVPISWAQKLIFVWSSMNSSRRQQLKFHWIFSKEIFEFWVKVKVSAAQRSKKESEQWQLLMLLGNPSDDDLFWPHLNSLYNWKARVVYDLKASPVLNSSQLKFQVENSQFPVFPIVWCSKQPIDQLINNSILILVWTKGPHNRSVWCPWFFSIHFSCWFFRRFYTTLASKWISWFFGNFQ